MHRTLGRIIAVPLLALLMGMLCSASAADDSPKDQSAYSDARLKWNIRDLPPGTLDKVLGLHGRNYEFTREARKKNLGEDGTHTGFVAQEVQTVFPEWVTESANGYLIIEERGTTALLVEALRDLRIEKDEQVKSINSQLKTMTDANVMLMGLVIELRDDIKVLRAENNEFRSRIIALEKIVEGMLGGDEPPVPIDVP